MKEYDMLLYDDRIERYVAQARKLRAEFYAHLMRQAWAGIKRLARRISQRSAHYVPRPH
ncbi:MAG: hypothetical protein HY526_10875 [Betaproteobacteria bacterium]|nr:hypothetical protein [Betaproteobacteria bacterium]